MIHTDTLQNTIYVNRIEDEKLLTSDDSISDAFFKQKYHLMYPVSKCEITDVHRHVVDNINGLEGDYDYVLVDTKGDINTDMLSTMAIMNTIFIPTEVSDSSVRLASSTGKIIARMTNKLKGDIELKNYYFIWNRYLKTPEVEEEIETFLDVDFSYYDFQDRFLKNSIPNRNIISERHFYNTILFPSNSDLKNNAPELLALLEEMYQIIETNNVEFQKGIDYDEYG